MKPLSRACTPVAPTPYLPGQDNVIEGIFKTLELLHSNLQAKAG